MMPPMGSIDLVGKVKNYTVMLHSFNALKMCFFVVFMSPEIATSSPCREIFKTSHFATNLCLVAIDEAHCIPEWYGLLAILITYIS